MADPFLDRDMASDCGRMGSTTDDRSAFMWEYRFDNKGLIFPEVNDPVGANGPIDALEKQTHWDC